MPAQRGKKMIAAAYFNQLAEEKGVSFVRDSTGIEPADSVAPVITAMLEAAGLDVSHVQPWLVIPEDFQMPARIISIDCTPEELSGAGQVEYWDDVPTFSRNTEGARVAICIHIKQLIVELGDLE